MKTEIVGREDELRTIERWLDSSAEPIYLIEGEAGIGKTTVWNAGVETARERGYRVLVSSAAGSETQLSFTALHDLLADGFDDVADELPAPQRRALGVTLLLDESAGAPPEPGAIAVAFLTALRVLAERSPTLLAIDDMQWLDAASSATLSYALRRLADEPLAVLLTRRAGGADQLQLERLANDRLQTLDLEPFTVGALGRILHDRLGVAYPRPTLQRLHEVSAGNPFFALELARALGHTTTPLSPGAPLPVPQTLQELIRNRLEVLPPGTLDGLTFVSAMARPSLELLGAAQDGDPVTRLVPAIDAHLVEVADGEIRFTHPLFAAAVYDLASTVRRHEVHRRLATVVRDDEERARQLALATDGPDEEIAATLEDLAHAMHARGHRIVCAELYESAARLTPEVHVQERARRTLAAADALFEAGDSTRSRELLEAVVDGTAERGARVEAGVLLGRMLGEVGRWADAIRLWRGTLELTRDPAIVADVQTCMATMTVFIGGARQAIEHADEAVRAAGLTADPVRLALAHAARAMAGVSAGDASYRAHLRDALELDPGFGIGSSTWSWSPITAAAFCARLALDLDEMRLRFGSLLERGVDLGIAGIEQYGAYGLAIAALAEGNHARAQELNALVLELAEMSGVMRLPAAILQAEIDTHLGRREEARSRLSAVVADSDALGWKRYIWQSRADLGRLALSEGDHSSAADELRVARQLAEEMEMGAPSILPPLVDEVEAAAGADLLDQAEEALAAAHRIEDPPAWGDPLLLRANAALCARSGELREAEAALERALELPAWPPQQGRTQLLLGVVQRRAKKPTAAKESIGAALATFGEIGAALWAERALVELQRIGGRTPSGGDLTPSERRVAELVAKGKSNKEVAAALVVSVHTVEAALTSIYRKLDVRSRTGLARTFVESD